MYKGDLIKRENGWSIVYSTPHSGRISEISVNQESIDLIQAKYGSKTTFVPDVNFSYSVRDGDAFIIFEKSRTHNVMADSDSKKEFDEPTNNSQPNKSLWEEELFSDNDPLSIKENHIMNHLVYAYNDFSSLEQTHPDDIKDFVFHIHALQRILGQRILRRDYPNIFPTHK
jgi:hypothetical protein